LSVSLAGPLFQTINNLPADAAENPSITSSWLGAKTNLLRPAGTG
jgi:hypothetical protein